MSATEARSNQGVAVEDSGTVNEDEVLQLDARAQEATTQVTGAVYRHYWGRRNGQNVLRLNWGGLSRFNQVYVSIHEGNFIGAARYTVHNVAPRDGGVDIWVNIEWGAPINLYVDYLVM